MATHFIKNIIPWEADYDSNRRTKKNSYLWSNQAL